MTKIDFLLVGVGGQGVLLASDVLAEVGLRAGYHAKKSEVHGMAQRGGSVVSHVRRAEKVLSPLIGLGKVDYLLGFEEMKYFPIRPSQAALAASHRLLLRPMDREDGAEASQPEDIVDAGAEAAQLKVAAPSSCSLDSHQEHSQTNA